jgi:uncharacterized protein YbaP (TraB family)
MRRLGLSLLTLLALLLLASGCSQPDAKDKLFAWQVESETATIVMVGSIHVGKPDFFPLAESLEAAFEVSHMLAVEVDMTDPDVMQKSGVLMMQHGMLPQGTTMQDRLSPELWERVEEYAAANEVNLAMYQMMKPGIAMMVLVLREYQKQGFDPELGIDRHFLDAAREKGKEIRSLETIEDQLDLFFSIDDQLDDVLVAEFLDQLDEIGPMIDQMIVLWESGDVEGLDKFLQDQVGEDPAMVDFYRRLLADRNVAMAEKIDTMLKEEADVFVVVGAGHFAGESGIVKLLEEMGHSVEQMTR